MFFLKLILSSRTTLAIILVVTQLVSFNSCCNFGLANFGVGNAGFLNFGVGNRGFLNTGVGNIGAFNIGIRTIGAGNAGTVNTISVANIGGPNLTPIFKRKKRSVIFDNLVKKDSFPLLKENV